MRDATKPTVFKPRNVAFAVKQELGKLEKRGVIKKVERSEWANSI